jgi:hypothetical protein
MIASIARRQLLMVIWWCDGRPLLDDSLGACLTTLRAMNAVQSTREVAVCREQFAQWWLTDATHEGDSRADRKIVNGRIRRVHGGVKDMTSQ